jgi:hypothetical protein
MSVPLLVLAVAITSAPGAAPSAAAPKPSSNTSDTRTATSEAASKASVEGCVVTGREAGRKADLAEKTGLDEHFVLAAAKVLRGNPPAVATTAAEGTLPGPMFKISGLTDEQLKIHVGRRVRIEGRFGSLEQPSSSAAAPQDNLVELNVATIRQVPGDCPVPKS